MAGYLNILFTIWYIVFEPLQFDTINSIILEFFQEYLKYAQKKCETLETEKKPLKELVACFEEVDDDI